MLLEWNIVYRLCGVEEREKGVLFMSNNFMKIDLGIKFNAKLDIF